MSLVGQRAGTQIAVTVDPAHVAAFARATGAEPVPGTLPITYPVSWLTRPEVVALVAGLAADRPGALPVHELQTVETLDPPAAGEALDLSVTATRTDADRITVEATATGAGRTRLRLTGILRLFEPAGPRP